MNESADIRRSNLRAIIERDGLSSAAKRFGKPDRQINDMLAGRKAFGEKVAREMERNYDPSMQPGWLDIPPVTGRVHVPLPPPPVPGMTIQAKGEVLPPSNIPDATDNAECTQPALSRQAARLVAAVELLDATGDNAELFSAVETLLRRAVPRSDEAARGNPELASMLAQYAKNPESLVPESIAFLKQRMSAIKAPQRAQDDDPQAQNASRKKD